jgi:hypothetical protein
MDWEECNLKKLVKRVNPDLNLIESLKKSSQKRIASANRLKIDETTSSSVISLCYEALRELLEAVSLSRGFKIYNHDCYAALLKEVMREEKLGILFDKFRQLRNRINYYGKEISPDDAKQLKEEIISLIGKIKEKHIR